MASALPAQRLVAGAVGNGDHDDERDQGKRRRQRAGAHPQGTPGRRTALLGRRNGRLLRHCRKNTASERALEWRGKAVRRSAGLGSPRLTLVVQRFRAPAGRAMGRHPNEQVPPEVRPRSDQKAVATPACECCLSQVRRIGREAIEGSGDEARGNRRVRVRGAGGSRCGGGERDDHLYLRCARAAGEGRAQRPVNNDVQAEYKYDKGDNRTNVNVVSPN